MLVIVHAGGNRQRRGARARRRERRDEVVVEGRRPRVRVADRRRLRRDATDRHAVAASRRRPVARRWPAAVGDPVHHRLRAEQRHAGRREAICSSTAASTSRRPPCASACAAGKWQMSPVWQNADLPMYMSTPVESGGYLYRTHHRSRGQFFCVDIATGKTMWTTKGREGENAAFVTAGRIGDGDDDRGRARSSCAVTPRRSTWSNGTRSPSRRCGHILRSSAVASSSRTSTRWRIGCSEFWTARGVIEARPGAINNPASGVVTPRPGKKGRVYQPTPHSWPSNRATMRRSAFASGFCSSSLSLAGLVGARRARRGSRPPQGPPPRPRSASPAGPAASRSERARRPGRRRQRAASPARSWSRGRASRRAAHASVCRAAMTSAVAAARSTDDRGPFAFSALPEGRFNLSASKPGHITGTLRAAPARPARHADSAGRRPASAGAAARSRAAASSPAPCSTSTPRRCQARPCARCATSCRAASARCSRRAAARPTIAACIASTVCSPASTRLRHAAKQQQQGDAEAVRRQLQQLLRPELAARLDAVAGAGADGAHRAAAFELSTRRTATGR